MQLNLKGFLLLFFTLLNFIEIKAQADKSKYEALWKKVDELTTQRGLTKDALAEVDKIYALARKEKQEVHVIKALIYQVRLRESLEENAALTSISSLQTEIKNSPQPASSILNSILAEKYWNYFQQHRWQLYNRTQTAGTSRDDIRGWSIADFHAKISALYLASIQDKKILQQTKLETYDPIIIKGNTRYLRPTLYDLLAFRALDYFRNDERDITKPAYAFEIRNENLFSPSATFIKLRITTNDTLSLHQKALLIYQDLLAFHASDKKPDALIDADISRIQLIYQYGVMENKESLYAKALEQISTQYPDEPAAAQASFLLAQWHAKNAARYDPFNDTTDRYEYLAAIAICEKVVARNVESEGRSNSMALLQEIRRKELVLETEKVNLPDQAFRTLVYFRNFSGMHLRIIPMTETLRNQFSNRFDDTYWKQLTSLKPIRNWNQPLPQTNDYQKHRVEVKIDGLPVGAYMLLASVNEEFSLAKNPLAVQYFHVSSISYINNINEYFVLDRQTGKPLPKADIQVWYQKYDYNARQNTLLKAGKLSTDNNGYFKLASWQEQQNNNIRLEISYNKDHLFLEDNHYTYYRDEESISGPVSGYERKVARSFFFTDRAIYRPGQTVFFKGIIITKDIETRRSKIFAGQKTVVKLFNANGEPADSLEVTTNEYGSYAGKFLLPQNALNGEFRLRDETMTGETFFSVEEYKRPKFYVDYQKIKGAYKVNDSILVTAAVKGYAGNNIDGAKVVFRIVRQPKFIYPWMFGKWGMPRASNMEIGNGTAITGADGQFTIRFKAIPDLTIDKRLNPIFDFKVVADVTDINGETRSSEITVPVSYSGLQLKLNVPPGQVLPLDTFRNISVISQNMNGEFEPALVQLTIHRLETPTRLIRARYWSEPDQFIIGKEEYEKLFPYDEYQHESDYRSWKKAEKVFETLDSTKANTPFEIRSTPLKEGWYVIEATARDKDGSEVKDVQYVQLYDDKSSTPPSLLYAWGTQKNQHAEPGNKSSVTIGSSAQDLFVIQQIDKHLEDNNFSQVLEDSTSSSTYRFIQMSAEKKSFDFNITENDRGGFGVYHFFIKNNRFYILSNQVIVPWTNKELAISYETFRDKTLPGSEEKWSLKISGYQKEKVAAEMMVSMYDASLDQFRPHAWMTPNVWPSYVSSQIWNGLNNFAEVQSQQKFIDAEGFSNFLKTFDRLLSPNTDQYRIQIRGRSNMLQESVVADAEGAMAKRSMAPQMDTSAAPQVAQNDQVVTPQKPEEGLTIQVRKNFNETAFFIPDLKTDSAGNIEFGFSIPEALTRWKFQGLALTKDAAFGYTSKDIITQKQLMVQPNAPRFLREGDRMELSTKIVNLTAKEITGTVHLELFNASTMQPVDGWFQNMTANQYFTAEAGQSIAANFTIQVPYQFNNVLVYRFTATAPLRTATDSTTRRGNNKFRDTASQASISDAEEASLPVLTNTMLVTESMPLPVRGNTARNFRFEKLLQAGTSETLHHHALTLEFTSNPAWYAVQSLPFLAEKIYECSEQSFSRFYANALATKIANTSPRILAIFKKWQLEDGALISNLEKNLELKSVILEETPWVLDSKNEALQRKNLALLFDMARMSKELESSLETLKQFQAPNGGFTWFKGGPDDRFMTQYILTGIGHLKKLDALPGAISDKLEGMIHAAVSYLDKRSQEDYANLIKHKSSLKVKNLGYLQVQYLYMRSFFKDIGLTAENSRAVNYYLQQSQQFWLQQNRYMQGMIALTLFRKGDNKIARDILKSLQQNAIVNEELGMYWKENRSGYYWYQAPVETQSLLIEAFSEVGKDDKTVDDLKTWLLKQKQTQNWRTTKATADACYALLLQGTDWLDAEPVVEIKLGDKTVKSNDEPQQAGSGYFKKVFEGPFVNPSMGEISVKVSSSQQKPTGSSSDQNKSSSAWGAVYWQYFENLDRITSSASPLKLVKKLFVEKSSDRGPILVSIHDGDALKPGDKVKVRIELSVDRDMEYLHMKDMRASCLEPVNVLSTYKWQGGLGYYESTKDASTNFFFNWLPKGSYVFEYPLFVTTPGNFSNGITSIQCVYAPEFSSHSEGIRVNVE